MLEVSLINLSPSWIGQNPKPCICSSENIHKEKYKKTPKGQEHLFPANVDPAETLVVKDRYIENWSFLSSGILTPRVLQGSALKLRMDSPQWSILWNIFCLVLCQGRAFVRGDHAFWQSIGWVSYDGHMKFLKGDSQNRLDSCKKVTIHWVSVLMLAKYWCTDIAFRGRILRPFWVDGLGLLA